MPLTIVPNSGQNLANTRDPIRINFSTIDTAFSVNHVGYGISGQGKHNFVSMPVQGADPGTAALEMALYTKNVAGIAQLFLRNQTNGSVVNMSSATLSNTNGTTTLPSGLILKWGRATTPGGGSVTVNFTSAFPTAVLTAYATIAVIGGSNASANDNVARIYNYTASQLSVVTYFENTARTRVSDTFTWFAIGY